MEAHVHITGNTDEEVLIAMDRSREALRKRMEMDELGMDEIIIELPNIELHVTDR